MRAFISVFVFGLFLYAECFSQIHPALDNVEIFTIDNQVALRFTMKPGNTCLGIGILRSPDSVNFDEIGIIGGVCGSPDLPVTYTFIDSFPISNSLSYYKLVLGLLGESKAIPYRFIDFTKQNALVSPNPMTTSGIITFSPEPVEEVLLSLFTADGSLLHSEKIRNANQAVLENIFALRNRSGLIVFSFTTPSGKIISSGSFVYKN